jgi:HD-GYP domain-containing protein (c-di-GMP phosphodiesterase class II)
MLRRITRDQVRLGMFIHAFDGPYLQHPFWLPRFRLTDPADLTRILESEIPGLTIDESRGVALAATEQPVSQVPVPEPAPSTRTLPAALLAPQRERSFEQEREQATKLIRHSTAEMTRLFRAVHAGEGMNFDDFTPLVCEVMSSVSRNPHALIALTRLRSRDEYTFIHSLSVSALLTRFGRSLGMAELDVFELGLAGLLHDVGKMIVPDKVLNKPGSLTDEEFALVRTHPEQGYILLSQTPDTPHVVLDVCRHHHERIDGTGYPFRLKGDAISRAARIAAICDVYDALTSQRAYKSAWSPEEAICRMYEWSGHFDRELLVQFMRAMGVYPPGLLVRLRSNRLAVTMPNGRRASRMKVRVFYCTRERRPLPLEDVTIDDNLAHDQILSEEYPLDWGFTGWPIIAEQLSKGMAPKLPEAAAHANGMARAA